ncbi:MAG: prolyl oligopeptidase family serine peptidase [Candidatus Yonathbacteria bacterium]|nr:prolyl oligopeptidase family serine peptidase [Candidatus Yonathbacteria bacterium]
MSQFHTEDVLIPADEERLDGTLYVPNVGNAPFPALLVLHGRGSNKSRYADLAKGAAEEGFLTLIFTIREKGNIISTGYRDAFAAFDFLSRDNRVDMEHIAVSGTSFGGYIASLLTRKRPIKNLILSAPALYKDDWRDIRIDSLGNAPLEYRKSGVYEGDLALRAIDVYTGSLFLITREFDEMCPTVVTNAYWERATHVRSKERYEIKGSGHRLIDERHRKESREKSVEWLKKVLHRET